MIEHVETPIASPTSASEAATSEAAGSPLDNPGVRAAHERGIVRLEQEAAHRAVVRSRRFDSIAVHGIYGQAAALENSGSIIEPAYLSPAQHFADADTMEATAAMLAPGWVYSRIANPTVRYLEETLALLEGYGFDGETTACATGSGMAAISMATQPFLSVDPADGGAPGPMNIVVTARCYGGTFQLVNERYGRERGVEVRWIRDPLDVGEWAARIDERTRFVLGEMPSNPQLSVFDIAAVAELAHAAGAPLIVDSTIATAALLRPLRHGADIVIHSLSKAVGGSGMTIAGAVVARRGIVSRIGVDELRDDCATWVKLMPLRDHGPSLNGLSALLLLNDLRTLRLRVDAWSRGAMRVATFLERHPKVASVAYPGLPSFEGHEVASRYLWLVDGDEDGLPVNRYGHLMGFRVAGGREAARRVFDRLEMIWRATDLGKSKSVATIPMISTHQQQGETGRDLAAIPGDLIRLSVGGEHPDDLMADLDHALSYA
jgi:O-acetylhomoserine/O-acetylserine sulfhydrylase-like pyridoxal-dependent enzyme